jgi:repressor LexA
MSRANWVKILLERFQGCIVAERLFEKRLQILGFLARRTVVAGSMPSIREIGKAVGLRSAQTVYHHLSRLEADGYLERLDDRPRTPVLTEKGWEVVGRAPLLGRVAAGRGLEAVAIGDETYSLIAGLLASRSGRRRYVLRVVGRSMTDARIEEGDLLVVEEDPSPPDGSVVVALLKGGEEATVKVLRREGDLVRLEARNGDHGDVVVAPEDVEIQGRVIHVIQTVGG